jgi:hypothetical protein
MRTAHGTQIHRMSDVVNTPLSASSEADRKSMRGARGPLINKDMVLRSRFQSTLEKSYKHHYNRHPIELSNPYYKYSKLYPPPACPSKSKGNRASIYKTLVTYLWNALIASLVLVNIVMFWRIILLLVSMLWTQYSTQEVNKLCENTN